MIGLPYLDTVAASTGYIVAMASPNDLGVSRQFNWARVLRHELVHVVTLQQTKFNIPHWYTEGLAVWCEGYPRPQTWNELLIDRVPRGKLFNLQTINAGFSRPGSGDQWQLAYCQAELYVEYMLSLGGVESQRKMLTAYADNLTTDAALRRVFDVSREQFERGYLAYVKQLTAGLHVMKRPSHHGYAELVKAHRDRPRDVDAAAELAYAYLCRNANPEALDLAREALKLRPKHPLATYVLARLRLIGGMEDEAAAMLDACLDRRDPESLVLELLADLKLKAKKYDDAAELVKLGQRLEPDNPQWTAALARVYLAAGKQQALEDTLVRLARIDSDDADARKKLAGIALARKDYAAAAGWANQALEIDVQDAEVHRLLAESMAGRGKYDAAIEEYEIAVDLKPSEPKLRFALAEACVNAHQPAKARETLRALLKLCPITPGPRSCWIV